MTTPIVNDVSPRNQFVALQDSTIFIYDFLVLVDSDLDVFLTPVGSAPSSADKLQLTVDYNVGSVGDSDGGNVTLVNKANAGDIITMERNSPIERPTNFNPGDFTVEEMNDALNAQVTFSQDNEVVAEKLTPAYTPSAIVEPGQVLLPQLGDGEFWIGSPDGKGLIKAKLDQAPDCADLRTDLAVEAEFTDGAGLVGYFDGQPVTGVGPTTVRLALDRLNQAVIIPAVNQISANNNIVLGGDFSTNPFQEGISFTAAAIGLARYIADGWGIQLLGAMRVETAKDPNDFVPISLSNVFSDNSLKITLTTQQSVLAAGDRGVLDQPIEGYYFRKIAERPFSISFYTRSSVIGTYCVALVSDGGDTSIVKEYTITLANTWEKQTLDFPASPSSANWGDFKTDRAVTLHFTLGAGTNSQQTANTWQANGNKIATANQVNFFETIGNTFNINLIQVEPTKVTPFQMRSQEEEIAFAQRYFEKSYNIEDAPQTITDTGSLNFIVPITAGGGSFGDMQQIFLVRKRITAVMRWFNPRAVIPFPPAGQGTIFSDSTAGNVTVISTNVPSETSTGQPLLSPKVDEQELIGHFTADARMPL